MENYGKFTEIYKRMQKYPSMSIPPGTDTDKSSIVGIPLLNGIAHFVGRQNVTWLASPLNVTMTFGKNSLETPPKKDGSKFMLELASWP